MKTIFLIDMNAFYISCEEKLDNSLRSKCAAVAGDPKNRTGIILTSNYNARNYGVKTAMTIFEAKKLCPQLVLVKPDHKLYSDVSKKIMNLLSDFSPVVEKNSIDEAWLDMTNTDSFYKTSFFEIAKFIQKKIYEKEQIPCSIGISYNKFLSKMAAELKKPNGITSIDKDNLKEILWPLRIEKMYGCGKVTSKKLREIDIKTIGDLATSNMVILRKKLGTIGETLYCNANGIDDSIIDQNREAESKSISKETTLTEDTRSMDVLINNLLPLIDDVSAQIRKNNYYFTTVYTIMKFDDFTKITRQKKVTKTNSRDVIFKTVKLLLKQNLLHKPVRLIGIGVTDLIDDNVIQLDMFRKNEKEIDQIYKVIDEKNEKYGSEVIKRIL